MKQLRKDINMRFILFVLGIIILTFGISFTILSSLGASPFDALLVGLAESVGLTVGSWEVILAMIIICCNALLKRQRPEILGLVTAIITGIGIDLWLFLFQNVIHPDMIITKVAIFGIGLTAIGFGTAIYLQTNFAPIPIDRLTLIIRDLAKTNIFITRTFLYVIFLILAFIFSGPIGVGTLLTVCFGGLVLNFFIPSTKKIIDFFVRERVHNKEVKRSA